MTETFSVITITNFSDIAGIRAEWNRLANTMKEGGIFHSFDWFECWYRAFCKSGNERIVLVYDKYRLRAVLPGMLAMKKVKGIPCVVFSYAGNGHSPRCGVIAELGDVEAVGMALSSVNTCCSFDFSIYPGVLSGTDTSQVIKDIGKRCYAHIEHRYYSPSCDISDGWDVYINTRTKSLKDRFKKGINRSRKLYGEPILDFADQGGDITRIIDRLYQLENKTWQHNNGSGLFSNAENSIFYNGIIKKYIVSGELRIAFVKIGCIDISYYLLMTNADTVYSLKMGYDPDFSKLSPGIMLWHFLINYYSDMGFKEYDLLGEVTDEKKNWATHYQEHSNYWIFNSKSPKGFLLRNLIKMYSVLQKNILRLKTQNILTCLA